MFQNDCLTAESNEVLKLKFQRLHETVVRSVNADHIIDRLFSLAVIGDDDMHWLHQQGGRRQQCRSLLSLLHGTGNQRAFVELYLAMKEEAYLQWLVEEIDSFQDKSVLRLKRQESQHLGYESCLTVSNYNNVKTNYR